MVQDMGNVVTESDSHVGDRAHLPSFTNRAGKMIWVPTGVPKSPQFSS